MAKAKPSRRVTTTKSPASKARAFGRSLADFGELNDAEKEVVAAAREGRFVSLGSAIPQTTIEKKTRTVRAGVVRFLALGGDDENPIHELGVRVRGVVINGELDLAGCTLASDLWLVRCDLSGDLVLNDAYTRTINLGGSHCRAIAAHRAKVGGAFLMRAGFVAKGVVLLIDAKIDGTLECSDGRFEGLREDGTALHCDRLRVDGGIFMRSGFVAKGAVRLLGAHIAGTFECDGGHFEGRNSEGYSLRCDRINVGGSVFLRNSYVASGITSLLGADIGGDVDCLSGTFGTPLQASSATSGEEAATVERLGQERLTDTDEPMRNLPVLVLGRAAIKGTLFLGRNSDETRFHGGVNLIGATIGRLRDMVTMGTAQRPPDSSSLRTNNWPAFLMLDGLSYARFTADTDLSADARIAFLRLQPEPDLGSNFKPHPWTQMIKTLRDAGHLYAARSVAIEFEKQRRTAGLIKATKWRHKITWGLHWFYGLLVGYGHRPMRLAGITLCLWLGCGILYHIAAVVGVFAPSNPLVFQNQAYAQCSPDYDRFDNMLPPKVGNWYWCKALPGEYTTFNPYIYSLDLILPLVDLQQERDWAPMIDTPRQHNGSGPWLLEHLRDLFSPEGWRLSHLVRIVMWFEILFGWTASLLFASVAAGVMKRMDGD